MNTRRADPESEAKLVAISANLADLLCEQLGPWIIRSIEQRASEAGLLSDEVRSAAVDAATDATETVGTQVRELLATDIDEQRATPLSLLRSAVRYPTDVLTAHGVPVPERPAYETDAFPDDLYGLSPANFADVDPELRVPGLEWGAAKAFVHLKRREP